jgi:DNA-directed RNA polymerase specialized sigma24 family protein|nr:helix-turn-helix domain-containing protein [Enterococcus phoeniculicola]
MHDVKSLVELVILVQKNDEEAFAQIVNSFKPLLVKESCRNGKFDEDCYQECLIRLFLALKNFEIRK